MVEDRLTFDPNRFTLGTLCRKKHQWGNTDQSLRRRSDGHCIECSKLSSIARKAAKGIKSKLWQEWEDRILIANYDSMTFEEISKLIPSRKVASIVKRARRLGLKKDTSWKDWENEILKQNYNCDRNSAKKIHEKWLANRTISAIQAQAARLGLTDDRAWTLEEDQLLYKLYVVCSHQEFETLIPGRTKVAVVARAYKLGLSRSNDWTELEISILRKYYDPKDVKLVSNLIPGRTRRMIIQKAAQLGLSNKRIPWENWEDNIIRENYEMLGGVGIHNQFLPHRTILSIRQRANSFGLDTRWSEQEIEIVRQHYNMLDWGTLLVLLPLRTKAAIQGKATQIGVAKSPGETWQKWEIELLREEYPEQEASHVHLLLPHRTTRAIIAKAFDLGLCKPSAEIRWTTEEKSTLRQYYGKMTYSEMHKLLPERAPRSICAMANSMGIVEPSNREISHWTSQEDQILARYYQDFGAKYVASLLKSRTTSGILSRASKLGLTYRSNWSDEEDDIICKHRQLGWDEVYRLLSHRTVIAIRHRAIKIGFKEEINRWNYQEDEILKDNYKKISFLALCLLLPERTGKSILKRATILNLKDKGAPRWTKEEDEIIINNYLHLNAKDLRVLIPHRGIASIYNRAQKLGLQKAFSGFVPRFYTRHSIHYNRYTTQELRARFNQLNDRCPYCHSSIDFDLRASFEWDHFIPVSKGGSDVMGNLIPCCPTCNIKKSNHDPYEWFKRQPVFSIKRWENILRILGKSHENYNQIPLV
jgi:hypothetical protein